jgi:DNA-binding GntR family transcriptional regulator
MDQAIHGDEYQDYESFIASDSELHVRLVALTDNHRLIQTYQGLSIHAQIARAHFLQTVEGARQAQQEHKAIFHAFEQGKAAEVKQALATHINNVKQGVLLSLDAQPD